MSGILSDKSFVGRTVFVTFLRLVAGGAAEISCEKGARLPFGILGCSLIEFEPVAERADGRLQFDDIEGVVGSRVDAQNDLRAIRL